MLRGHMDNPRIGEVKLAPIGLNLRLKEPNLHILSATHDLLLVYRCEVVMAWWKMESVTLMSRNRRPNPADLLPLYWIWRQQGVGIDLVDETQDSSCPAV